MKSVLVIGLGRFGTCFAKKMMQLGNEVMAMDISEERVNEIAPIVTSAEIGDCTKEALIASIGVRNFDLCVVAIGDNFQSSLEITALLKDYGAPYVLARANRDVHAKFLLRNGADEVAYPEQALATHLAALHTNDSIFDFIRLNDEYSIYEIAAPREWVGKTILKANVRTKHGVNILAIKNGESLTPNPQPSYEFTGEEKLVVMATDRQVDALLR
ncbi:MAG: TrkA family potassium uptake protein [Butyricicoccus pullicaecorum]|nr:TrkA family potassium uptake protein [Butyricicoccus pullicaecorum]